MVVYHLVNRMTGYDKLAADGNADVSGLKRYEDAYRRVATAGWERTTDCNLTIGYKDGYLYDLDTSYGYGPGQTAWQGNFSGL